MNIKKLKPEDVLRATMPLFEEFRRVVIAANKCCPNCYFFDEDKEVCNKVGQRPPARVIATGCEFYDYDIPF